MYINTDTYIQTYVYLYIHIYVLTYIHTHKHTFYTKIVALFTVKAVVLMLAAAH